MENNLPLPAPDKRILNDYYIDNTVYNGNEEKNNLKKESYYLDTKFSELKESKLSSISMAQMMQMEDMRLKIFSYSLLSDKSIYLNSIKGDMNIKKCNIILFGPPKAGKSCFIKSLYQSLYNEEYLPEDSISNLIIRNKNNNESALLFGQYNLILETENNSGIMICDTGGNLKNNNNQNNIILDGQKKESKQIEQMLNKDQSYLLDFWNKPIELFPKEIFKDKEGKGNIKSLPHSIVLIFDGSNDEIIPNKDIKFYKDLVDISKDKGYKDIHIILTKLDELEKKICEKYQDLWENEINSKLKRLKDIQIEKIISILGVKRSNIHFIENYHSGNEVKNSADIDYNLLKAIIDILNSSELFILEKMNKEHSCFGFLCL